MRFKNQNLEEINCPICSKSEYATIANKGQFSIPMNVSICKGCGLTYLNPRWTKEKYISFYKKDYDKYYRSYILSVDSSKSRTRNMEAILKRLQEYGRIKESAHNIVDIGCGMGWGLLYLQKKLQPTGRICAIESSEYCVKHLKRNSVDVIAKDLDTDWHLDKKGLFDLAIMRHVLEHMLNPIDVLRKIASSLNEEGLLYIAVPDLMSPTLPVTTVSFRVVHTFYFSQASLRNAFCLSGLEVVASGKKERSEIWYICKKGPSRPPNIEVSEFKRVNDFYAPHISYEGSLKFKFKKSIRNSQVKCARLLAAVGFYNIMRKVRRMIISDSKYYKLTDTGTP